MSPLPLKSPPSLPSTEDLWRDRVAAWRHSGMTVEAFCHDKPFAASTLRWWSSRLRKAPPLTFVEVRPRAALSAPAPATLVVEIGAARVQLTEGFDPKLLASVVAALSGASR